MDIFQCYAYTENMSMYIMNTSMCIGTEDSSKQTQDFVIGVICCVGVLANILAFLVFSRDPQWSKTVTLLRVLALADTLYLIAALVRHPLPHAVRNPKAVKIIELVSYPLINCFQTICIWIMVLVTVDRYLCVCHPLSSRFKLTHQSRIHWSIGLFIAGFLFNLPRFFEQCYIATCIQDDTIYYSVLAREVFRNSYDLYLYIYASGFLYLLFSYGLPLSTLFFTNTRLVQAIKKSRRRLNDMSETSNLSHNHVENNATLVLIITVIVFIICQTPESLVILFFILASVTKQWEKYDDIYATVVNISSLLMIFNSSVNFFIYIAFGRRFLSEFKRMFGCGSRPTTINSSLTMNTYYVVKRDNNKQSSQLMVKPANRKTSGT